MLILLLFLAGVVLSTPVSAQVPSGSQQRIVISPIDTKVLQGEDATLKCKVANQAGTVQWTRDRLGMGSDRELIEFERYRMGGSTANGEYNLEITSVSLDDDSVYQCQIGATETQPLRLSPNVQLTVLVPPAPPKLSVGAVVPGVEGRQIEVSCVSELAKPAAQLFWVLADNPQATGARIDISGAWETDGDKRRKKPAEELRGASVKTEVEMQGKLSTVRSHLKLTPRATDDGWYVVCLARHETHPDKALTAASKLTLQYAPVVRVVLNTTSGAELRENGATALRCLVDAKPAVRTIRWTRDGVLLSGLDTDTLSIVNLTSDYHNKMFSCEATNSIGSRTAQYQLKLQYGPKITGGDVAQPVTANAGDDVTMACVVDSNPPADVRWTREFAASPILHTGANFTLKSVRRMQQGGYRCEASVPGFNVAHQMHYVHINGRPSVSLSERVETALGETVEMMCNVSGFPPAQEIYWTKDGVHLGPHENKKYLLRQFAQTNNGLVNILTVTRVERADFGVYNCTARNALGTDFALARLVAPDALPLYLLVPCVTAAIVLVLLLTLAVFLLSRRACCSAGKASHSGDSQSDVHVKVEALDGQCYPDMYSPAPTMENGDVYSNSKDYISVPQDNPDLDFLPPPYGHQQQFIYQPNGAVVAVLANGGGSAASHHQLLPPGGVSTSYEDDNEARCSTYYDVYGPRQISDGPFVPSPSLPNGHMFQPPPTIISGLPPTSTSYGNGTTPALHELPSPSAHEGSSALTPLLPGYHQRNGHQQQPASTATSTFRPTPVGGSVPPLGTMGGEQRPNSRGSTHV